MQLVIYSENDVTFAELFALGDAIVQEFDLLRDGYDFIVEE